MDRDAEYCVFDSFARDHTVNSDYIDKKMLAVDKTQSLQSDSDSK